MSSYKELIAKQQELAKQAAEIEKLLDEARRAERATVIAQIKTLLSENGLTVADLGIKPGAKSTTTGTSSTAGRKVAPKYRNNETGESWTGRGLQPKWIQAAIASGKKLEDFAI